MILSHVKFLYISTIYNKMILLLLSFILFGIIYFLFCDDHEFGGINILQEELRKQSLKKIVNKKLSKPGLTKDIVFDELVKDISYSGISDKVEKTMANEVSNSNIEKDITNINIYQKIFDRIYFSIVTGTTLGYGDIYPLSNKVKILIIIQLFITIFILFH